MKQTNLTLAEKLEALRQYENDAVIDLALTCDGLAFIRKIDRMQEKMKQHAITPQQFIAYNETTKIRQAKGEGREG